MQAKIQAQSYVTRYSGTTVENYETCALVRPKRVLFVKGRESRHEHSRLYLDDKFNLAVVFAVGCAKGRIPEHTPLIMEGRFLEEELGGYSSLDTGRYFPVDRLWIPKEDVNWHALDTVFDKNLKRHFQELDTKQLLYKGHMGFNRN